MPEQFLNPKMTFGPPAQKAEKSKVANCDHEGVKKVYLHGRWECERCGEVVE